MKSLLMLIAICAVLVIPANAQNPTTVSAQNQKLTSKIVYHDGPVLRSIENMYVIWYGCWTDNCGNSGDTKTVKVINDFLATLGNTPYAQINSTYTDAAGNPATGTLIYGGEAFDSSYSHGAELTDAGIQGIIGDLIMNFQLPQDPEGIYIVIGSADVASNATGFCSPGAPPYHRSGIVVGGQLTYVFVGNPNRCPTVAGPQFLGPGGVRLPTPHDSYAGDVLASNIAHALNTTLTNPYGSGWFDRYGLENADKCVDAFGQPSFGPTFQTANGARANLDLGVSSGKFLIQQNWVNDRKPHCGMSR